MKDVEFVFEPKVLESWSTTTSKFYGEGFVLTGNVTEFLDPVFSSALRWQQFQAKRLLTW